jgi:SAM-dependent methyltransferase
MSDSPFSCRACGAREHELILDMGNVPLANAFVADASGTADQERAPLALVICLKCSLLQIRDEVPREKLFKEYLWMTSTSAGAKRHAEWLSARLRERYGAEGKRPFLVEVASNDGFFLQHYRDAGFDILGVDPSNFAVEADKRGLPSIRDFFGEAVAKRILSSRGPADLIVARNVLGHSSELRDLLAGMKKLLAGNGVLVFESPYAYMLRAETQYDTIFHEHLSYLTVGSLANLFASYALKMVDIDFVDMNGGSLLCEIVHESNPRPRNDHTMLEFERLIELNSVPGWRRFSKDVARQRDMLLRLLGDLKARGKRVVAYGAAAKFMTMLNYCGIGPALVEACGDANERKQGLLCPGVRIPVVSPRALMEMRPDYVLIGAWNFRDEIMGLLRTQFGYRGEFILPLPIPEIVAPPA